MKQSWSEKEWMVLCDWMAAQEEKRTPWEERKKLWAQLTGVRRTTQSLRAAYNRWNWGYRPECLKENDKVSSSLSETSTSAEPEGEQKSFDQAADSSTSLTGSYTSAQTAPPQMSRLQRRNKRREISRRVAIQLERTIKYCAMATRPQRIAS